MGQGTNDAPPAAREHRGEKKVEHRRGNGVWVALGTVLATAVSGLCGHWTSGDVAKEAAKKAAEEVTAPLSADVKVLKVQHEAFAREQTSQGEQIRETRQDVHEILHELLRKRAADSGKKD